MDFFIVQNQYDILHLDNKFDLILGELDNWPIFKFLYDTKGKSISG